MGSTKRGELPKTSITVQACRFAGDQAETAILVSAMANDPWTRKNAAIGMAQGIPIGAATSQK